MYLEIFTYQDYLKYSSKSTINLVEEETEEYNMKLSEEEEEKIDKIHDKMFREILKYSEEMAEFINQYLNLKEHITKENLIKCNTNYITNQYKSKEADIVYQLKNKEIYFLIEHQTKVDYNMPYRMFTYIKEVMKDSMKGRKIGQNDFYPLVIPVVLYTGIPEWTAKRNLTDKQPNIFQNEEVYLNLKYNLVDIHNHNKEELRSKKTLLAKALLMEKCESKEELIKETENIISSIETKDKTKWLKVMEPVLRSMIGKNTTQKLMKEIEDEEVIGMTPLAKGILEENRMLIRTGREESKREMVENMLKLNFKEEIIKKITGMKQAEINEIRKQMQIKLN